MIIFTRTEWTIFDEKSQLAGSVDMCYVDDSNNMLRDYRQIDQCLVFIDRFGFASEYIKTNSKISFLNFF